MKEGGALGRGEVAAKDGGAAGRRGAAVLDFILRLVASAGTLASAVATGTSDETLPFSTQFLQFQAQYNDIPTLTLFLIANAIVCGYLILSLPLSLWRIVRGTRRATNTTLVLLFSDTVMLAFLTAAASASAAIMYLAHNGDAQANWFSICQQFNNFCQRNSGALIGSFGAAVMLMLIVFLSAAALAIRRH